MAPNNNLLAHGDVTAGSYHPPEIFSGEAPILTDFDTFAAGQVIPQYSLIGRQTANGKLYIWSPGASDGTQNIVGLTSQPLDTSGTGTNADTQGPYVFSAVINFNFIATPRSGATLATVRKNTDRTPLRFQVLSNIIS